MTRHFTTVHLTGELPLTVIVPHDRQSLDFLKTYCQQLPNVPYGLHRAFTSEDAEFILKSAERSGFVADSYLKGGKL